MLARAALGKESVKSAATNSAKPAHANEHFSIEPQLPEHEFTAPRFSWSIGNVAVTAPNDGDGTGAGDDVGPTSTARCFARPPWPIQAKLEVGAVDDPLEREADRTADAVVGMADPGAVPASAAPVIAPAVQRKCECGGTCDKCRSEAESETVRMKSAAPGVAAGTPAPPSVQAGVRSPGQPLDGAARAFMEPRFG